MDLQSRRAQATADNVQRTGIDEAMIDRLVRTFYDRVRADAVLGPIFAGRIKDWDLHLERMCAFWSSVALMSGRYHGQPMEKHLPLPVDARHFDRWLELFEETARQTSPRTRRDISSNGLDESRKAWSSPSPEKTASFSAKVSVFA